MGEPWRSALSISTVLITVYMAVLFGLWLVLQSTRDSGYTMSRVPEWLGGQDGGRAVFAVLAAFHALVIVFTCRAAATRMIGNEAGQGTLFQLLLSRMRPFEMVLQMTVYPLQQGLILALAGLPCYFMLISFGSVGIHEVAVLYLILIICAIASPSWTSPAFAEISPEDLGRIQRENKKQSGCLVTMMIVVGLPMSCIVGAMFMSMHLMNPHAFDRIPTDVWPALPAIPITFAWVAVRILTAPYSWFGLPLPLWVFILPMILLYRLRSIWRTSLYLKVAEEVQMMQLPEYADFRAYTSAVGSLWQLGLIGYIWQPFMESAGVAASYWPNATGTPSECLSAGLYYCGVIAVISALLSSRPKDNAIASFRSRDWSAIIRLPMVPFALAVLAGLIRLPGAFFSVQVLQVILTVCLLGGAVIWSQMRLRALTVETRLFLALVPIVFLIVPFSPISWFAAVSPFVAALSGIPAYRNTCVSNGFGYVAPQLWFGILTQLIVGGFAILADSRGWFQIGRLIDTINDTEKSAGSPAHSVETLREHLRPAPVSKGWDFNVESPQVVAQPIGMPSASPSQDLDFFVTAEPPSYANQQLTYTSSETYYGPSTRRRVARLALNDWRNRALSPAATAVFNYLWRRTDNPVAIMSARRVLPGTLNTDQLIAAIVAVALGLLLGYQLPGVFYAAIFPVPIAFALYPPVIMNMIPGSTLPDHLVGMQCLMGLIVGITLIRPWTISKTVADEFRMERERSTLGFVLMTPLSSRGVIFGHCIGALLPALALWLGAVLCGVVPTVILAASGFVAQAVWGWAFGFGFSLLYLLMCGVVGLWIGVTEVKARDMTIGVYLLPVAFCVISAGCVYVLARFAGWGYFSCVVMFMVICIIEVLWLARDALKELNRVRTGDVPFEGRTVTN